ncbi:MAG: tyrosine-type recombinase/integrase [Verrucomicrobia bacterium]|nr:tyrosine-type recombinase/integrase [Verrucomicrobiota bacterium]
MAKADKSKTRSARGTGRLYKRTKDGKEYPPESKVPGVFWLQYTIDGKRTRNALTGKDGKPITDLRQAEAERKRLTAPMRAGKREEQLQSLTAALVQAGTDRIEATEAAAPVLPIAEAWEAYLQNPERPDTGIDTLRYYETYWKKGFMQWLSENAPDVHSLRDITPKHAQDYAATLNGATASPNTYNKHAAFLKLFFRVLQDAAGLKANPFEKIRRKALKTASRRELTIAELKALLESATGELQTLFYLGTFTGLRLGDCCTLTWGETDLDRELIKRIPNKTAKSGKPVLIGIAAALLEKLSETPPSKRKGYVLPRFAKLYTHRNAEGRPVKQPDISNEIQAHFTACGIQTIKEGTGKEATEAALKAWEEGGKKGAKPTCKRAVLEVGFHSLRHTWVSLHAAAGTPQGVIQNVIGHANPAMTAHYLHVNEGTARHTARAWQLNEPEQNMPAQIVPPWIKELAKTMTAKNWKAIKAELIGGEK